MRNLTHYVTTNCHTECRKCLRSTDTPAGVNEISAQVFFKMDKTGDGQEICLEDLANNSGLSFIGFNQQMFLEVTPSSLTYALLCDLAMLLPSYNS